MRNASLLPVLLAVLLLSACTDQSSASRDAEVRALRERVERLEQEAAQDRARLAEDVDVLRQSLDEANRHAEALEGGGAANPGPAKTGQTGKSPRAALRESFNKAVEASRQALERLNKSLEESLARSKAREPAPAK
jgi:uncharacterized membrane protein YccC